jgi:hypothetical protein
MFYVGRSRFASEQEAREALILTVLNNYGTAPFSTKSITPRQAAIHAE